MINYHHPNQTDYHRFHPTDFLLPRKTFRTILHHFTIPDGNRGVLFQVPDKMISWASEVNTHDWIWRPRTFHHLKKIHKKFRQEKLSVGIACSGLRGGQWLQQYIAITTILINMITLDIWKVSSILTGSKTCLATVMMLVMMMVVVSWVWCRSNNPDWVQDMFGEDFVQAVSDRVTFAVQHFDGQVL